MIAAQIETLAGDDEAAEAELRWAYETLERMGEMGARASIGAFLAESIYRLGRDDEALGFTEITEELAADDDLEPQVLWRSVRAKVLANRGEFEQAEKLARDAAELVEGTDFPELRALAFLSLAEVLEASGATEEAEQLVGQALATYEHKGNTVAAGLIVSRVNSNGRAS